MERNVNLLIKPVSGSCNMNCSYCFYEDEMANRTIKNYGKMSEETLKVLLKKVLAHAKRTCAISFQGGEPTLAGLDFFNKSMELQREYNVNNVIIQNAIQTNGYNLDKEWIKFFKDNNFLVGISLDGMPKIHNKYRKDKECNDTFSNVIKTIELLKKYEVEYNILTVVTKEVALNIDKVYHFFVKNKIKYQQYIPCLDNIGESKKEKEYSLTKEMYAKFLKDLFDCWYEDMINNNYVYIRYFENLVGMLKGIAPEHCGMMGICGNQWIAEADGSIYPCDFYVLDKYRLGNITEDELETLQTARKNIKFVEESEKINEDCQKCNWYPLCRNGCKREREFINGSYNKNYYCESFLEFFPYAVERLKELI